MGFLFVNEDFAPLLGYSISLLNRINKDLNLAEDINTLKNISIMGIAIDFLDQSIMNALSQSLRSSDALFLYDNFIIMLLFGTSKEGAITLGNQLKEFFGENSKYTVITYPEDGSTYQEILDNFRLLLKLKLNVDFYRF